MAISAGGQGTTLLASNTNIINNVQDRSWDGIIGTGGASVEVFDSLLQGNEGLGFGISSQSGVTGDLSRVIVERTNFVDNVAFNDPDNGPRALVSTIGNGSSDPILELRRIDFDGNTGFVVSSKDGELPESPGTAHSVIDAVDRPTL